MVAGLIVAQVLVILRTVGVRVYDGLVFDVGVARGKQVSDYEKYQYIAEKFHTFDRFTGLVSWILVPPELGVAVVGSTQQGYGRTYVVGIVRILVGREAQTTDAGV